MSRVGFFLFLSLVLTACGGQKGPSALSLREYNQRCLEGKILGEYLVRFSDGSHEVIHASSPEDLMAKVSSHAYSELLESRNLVINDLDYNFKVKSLSTKSEDENPSSRLQYGPEQLNAPNLWEKGWSGRGVSIALIDSGYDFSHPLLRDSVLQNTEDLGNDEDKNGFKGDTYGWNFILDSPLTGDSGFHGTAVGSVISAKHNDFYSFSMAPGSKIVPIAGLEAGIDESTDGSGDSNSVILALRYARLRGVDIVNASWGGDTCSSFLRDEIKLVTDSDIIFVTASGNEGLNLDQKLAFPASFDFDLLLTVGALAQNGERLSKSNYGSVVDFFSLGHDVLAASPQGNFRVVSGTSIAAPLISGALALLKEAFPLKSNQSLIEALKSTANQQKTPDLSQAFEWLEQHD